jgi:hypothetical protein
MKRGLLLLSLFSIFFLFTSCFAEVYINEIMPHSNNSFANEWLELYNSGNEILNLSSWKIADKVSNDTFSLIIYPESYALIVDDGNIKDNLTGCKAFNISNESCYELSTIGSGLNDENETVFLYNESNFLIDNFSWIESIKSTGKSWSKNNLAWQNCTPTPGFQNFCENFSQNNESENKDDENEKDEESTIKIEHFDKNVKFGQEIEINLEIYKGSTNKYAVYVYIEDENEKRITEKEILHLRTKYHDYDESISLKLDCINDSGNYKITAEGLDEKDTEKIYIESCYEGKIQTISQDNQAKKTITSNKLFLEQQDQEISNNPITGSAILSSENENRLFLFGVMIMLLFLTILLVSALIYRKIQ